MASMRHSLNLIKFETQLLLHIITWLSYVVMLTNNALRDNFTGFACWGDLILREFQNQFCACSAQPGQKCEPGSLFNTEMPASLRVKYCVILMTITINSMLRLLLIFML